MRRSPILRRKHTMIKPVLRLDKVEDDLVDLNEGSAHRVLGDLVIYLSSFLMVALLNSLVLMVAKMRKQNWSLILLIVTNDESSNSNMIAMICVARVTESDQNMGPSQQNVAIVMDLARYVSEFERYLV